MKIFPMAGTLSGIGRVKLNRKGDRLTLIYLNQKCVIDTDVLRKGSSTLVIYNPLMNSIYPLFNFRELCQVWELKAKDFCEVLQVQGLMQIDVCDEVFVKVFLPRYQHTLDSDTDDYTQKLYEGMHDLDFAITYKADNICVKKVGEDVYITLDFHKSLHWEREVYLSHGGQFKELHEGRNEVRFKYNPTEDAYIGEPNSRYPGRAILLKDYLYGS